MQALKNNKDQKLMRQSIKTIEKNQLKAVSLKRLIKLIKL